MKRTILPLMVVWVSLLAFSPTYADDVSVDCSKAKKKDSITAALANLSRQGPHTITVTGACSENVVIRDFDGLTLKGNPGASVDDPTPTVPDDNDVIDITRSRNITVRDLAINGGLDAITCFLFSECHLLNLTIQGAQEGVAFARSLGVVGDNTVIQNNAQSGMSVIRGSHVRVGPVSTTSGVTIQANGGLGILVEEDSYLDVFQSAVQNHALGDGVVIGTGSHVQLFNVTIAGNAGRGVSVGPSSVLRVRGGLGPNQISGNGGHGVVLDHLTFLSINGPRDISGNAAPDVNCSVSTAKTSGTGGSASPNLGGGTTNCTEPAP